MNRKKHMKKSTFIKVLGVFFLVLFLFIFGIMDMLIWLPYPKDVKDINLERDYIQTKASVLSTGYLSNTDESYNLSTGNEISTVYEYFDEDKVKHKAERNFSSSSMKQGDEINVYYKKTNPDESIPEILTGPSKSATLGLYLSAFLTIVPTIITIVIGFIIESRDKKRREGIE